jgi:anti-sigma-K factor RskA
MFAVRTSTTTPSVAPSESPAQVAVAALKPYDDPGARGTAVVREASSAQRTVTVSVSGLPAKPGSFYEVWLMDPSNAHLVALGVLDAHGDGTFSVPPGIDLHAYSALDVSLQPMNGSPLHSGDSPVRGEIDA